MISGASKSIIKESLNSVGIKVHRRDISSSHSKYPRSPRSSPLGLLQQARKMGLSTTPVTDAGWHFCARSETGLCTKGAVDPKAA